MIAALYVDERGPYIGLEGVEPWGVSRDARLYPGPHPVVAHPPCARWGRYATGGPSATIRRIKGDDGGCFASALASIRRWGGVLEHPEASSAWKAFGLLAPPREGGWVAAGDWIGWTCCVEQGHYGHAARKATWLYACGVGSLPSLRWGPSEGKTRVEPGYHSTEKRIARAAGVVPVERLSRDQRIRTPIPFRDLLLSIARASRPTPIS